MKTSLLAPQVSTMARSSAKAQESRTVSGHCNVAAVGVLADELQRAAEKIPIEQVASVLVVLASIQASLSVRLIHARPNGDTAVERPRAVPSDGRLLDAQQAAAFLQVSIGTLRNLTYRRELSSVKIKRRVRYRLEELERLVKRSTRKAVG